jgi:hypothetical protein
MFDAPKACSPSSSSQGDPAASAAASRRSASSPELARPVVADEPDALQAGCLRDGGPEQDRLAPSDSPGDALEAAQLARRLDGHHAHSRLDGRRQLLVALAGPGEHDPVGADPRPKRLAELAAGRDVGAQPEVGEVAQDREVRVRLDRVGEVERGRQDGPERGHLARDHVEVVGEQRGAEARGEGRRIRAAEAAVPEDLVASGRPAPA